MNSQANEIEQNITISEEQATTELENNRDEAEELLKDSDKTERFLQRIEEKLKNIPLVGSKLSNIPVMISLVRSYIKKQYTDLPLGTIIAIISALIYFLSPIDILPDSIPVLGYFDDATVIGVCWKLVESDVNEYVKWRESNGMKIEF